MKSYITRGSVQGGSGLPAMREGEISRVWLVLEVGQHDLMMNTYYASNTCPSCGPPKCPHRSLLGAEPASLAVPAGAKQ